MEKKFTILHCFYVKKKAKRFHTAMRSSLSTNTNDSKSNRKSTTFGNDMLLSGQMTIEDMAFKEDDDGGGDDDDDGDKKKKKKVVQRGKRKRSTSLSSTIVVDDDEEDKNDNDNDTKIKN
jgi:hypothetical protein